jgi:hypothetical protein
MALAMGRVMAGGSMRLIVIPAKAGIMRLIVIAIVFRASPIRTPGLGPGLVNP